MYNYKFTKLYKNSLYKQTKKQLLYLFGLKYFLFTNKKKFQKNIVYEQNTIIFFDQKYSNYFFPFFSNNESLKFCSSLVNSKSFKSILQNTIKNFYFNKNLTI
jgi:hypothetical protein